MGNTTDGTVERSNAASPVLARLVEPRVQPIFMTMVAFVPVPQAHTGRPLASKGAESEQTTTRAPGIWVSRRLSQSVICALAMARSLVQAALPTLKQYAAVVGTSGVAPVEFVKSTR